MSKKSLVSTVVAFGVIMAFTLSASGQAKPQTAKSSKVSEKKEAKQLNGNEKASITINGRQLSLIFQSRDIPSQLQDMMLSDLESILSKADPMKWHPYSGEKRIDGKRITHQLGNDWEKDWFPEILKKELWPVVSINEAPHLVISQELINAYRKKWKIQKENPDIFKKLEDFMALLNNTLAKGEPTKSKFPLLNLNNNSAKITDSTYRKLYTKFFKPVIAREGKFLSPALLDIRPFKEWGRYEKYYRDKNFSIDLDNAFVTFTPIVELHNENNNFIWEWPLVYANNKWHFVLMRWRGP